MTTEEIGEMKQQIKSINSILIGNGAKGLIRKVDEIMETVIKLKSDHSLKMWIYRGTIVTLIALTTFMASELYHIKFGG